MDYYNLNKQMKPLGFSKKFNGNKRCYHCLNIFMLNTRWYFANDKVFCSINCLSKSNKCLSKSTHKSNSLYLN